MTKLVVDPLPSCAKAADLERHVQHEQGHAVDDGQARARGPPVLGRIVGDQPQPVDAEIAEDLRARTVATRSAAGTLVPVLT